MQRHRGTAPAGAAARAPGLHHPGLHQRARASAGARHTLAPRHLSDYPAGRRQVDELRGQAAARAVRLRSDVPLHRRFAQRGRERLRAAGRPSMPSPGSARRAPRPRRSRWPSNIRARFKPAPSSARPSRRCSPMAPDASRCARPQRCGSSCAEPHASACGADEARATAMTRAPTAQGTGRTGPLTAQPPSSPESSPLASGTQTFRLGSQRVPEPHAGAAGLHAPAQIPVSPPLPRSTSSRLGQGAVAPHARPWASAPASPPASGSGGGGQLTPDLARTALRSRLGRRHPAPSRMIISFHWLTSPYVASPQPCGPRDSTPITRPLSSRAGPPESPEHVPGPPCHSVAFTLLYRPPQSSPTHFTSSPSRRMRVPLESWSFGSVSP